MPDLPTNFDISLDASGMRNITSADLDEIESVTGATVLVNILRRSIDEFQNPATGPGVVSDHSKASWSYST